ncbi:N,N-dimethylformamidase beta subunit family domain-containing protein [Paenactinomyces guangxiensis]|uniref:N,N-dimethylformamidase beta subunit-like C-terminal domain-containing protein n=1 Tax=Paenactinomyces guangxiensis TaxID=1490290 RepID=A0A7W1WU09_9BACL|nr:N,N-dimethylformamidase beta subunit family domain-containing protein [Paenactinomyces guangxiensis]MBA4496029.1 hypothetical protein [Paenactinomyces guangxiensis]MBH8593095.1 hypothetical protein [Paenactinomyces guangxiensis]
MKINRRDFIKTSSFFAMCFTVSGASTFLKWIKEKPTAFAANSVTGIKKVPVQIKDFDRVGQALLKLRYAGKIPDKLQVNVVNKKGTILAEGTPIKPTTPAFLHKVQKVDDKVVDLVLSLSPEMIAGNQMYIDIRDQGNGFRFLSGSVVVEKTPQQIVNNQPIEGYTSRVSYAPGETIELKVHSTQARFSVDFIRYGEKEHVVSKVKNIPGKRQNYPLYAYRNGAGWDSSYRFKVPEDWKSGLYAARLYDQLENEFYVSFLISRIDKNIPKQQRIAVLSSTNTWAAYNTWGGASLYQYFYEEDIRPAYAQMVSTERPNPAASPMGNPEHLANAEKLILGWLEKNHYPYSVISDWDLDQNPDLLDSFGTLIINTHGEYWTESMYDALERFLNRGGNLLTLSGNAIYWKTVLKKDKPEVRKKFGYHLLNGERGGLWFNLDRSESYVLGVRYTPEGYMTFHPYRVEKADHWVFKGTNLKNGDLIGERGLNRGGASGHETDKMDKFTPKNAVLLAKGTNPDKGGAEMVYYDHHGGGGVFSVGSISFGGSLVIDERLSRIVKNVLNHFTKRDINQ